MQIEQRLPELSDKELENLHGNAVRLAQSGSPAQRRQVETLLPLVGAELESRSVARSATHKLSRRTALKRKGAIRQALKEKLA